MFKKILIANRGEIACRILASARRLGLLTVAVYSEADTHARHVKLADEAYLLGPAPSQASYLCIDKLIQVAQDCGADALHPGYGFLSENPELARACSAAGIIFIGPCAEVIANMGDKAAAKRIAEQAGAPLLTSYEGRQGLQHFKPAAQAMGYPVLLKAVAGGGGKGMRIVHAPEELPTALEAAAREAETSFGNPRLLMERYLDNARHIEVQVFADQQGQVLHLFERDCSIQRRYQKILEEAPAPQLKPELRIAMTEVAVALTKALNYAGAGTLEFLLDPGSEQFYFMEMNTRLQVEHRVTEAILGIDLVEWQIRIAAGEPLPVKQADIRANGHAIEARIYAENPYQGFLPSTGDINFLRLPETSAMLQVDHGLQVGDTISPHYDPMLAKITAHGPDRAAARQHLCAALQATQIVGVKTNVPLLIELCQTEAFRAGQVHTGFLRQHPALTTPTTTPPNLTTLAAAWLAQQARHQAQTAVLAAQHPDPDSPWWATDHWRLSSHTPLAFTLYDAANTAYTAHIDLQNDGLTITYADTTAHIVSQWLTPHDLRLTVNNNVAEVTVVPDKNRLHLWLADQGLQIVYLSPATQQGSHTAAQGSLRAPMPGTVTAIYVQPGDQVEAGDTLMVMETMKMEHSIQAPTPGQIAQLHFALNDYAEEGALLLNLNSDAN